MNRLGNALIIALGVFSAFTLEATADTFPWRHDLDSGRAEAAQTGRLVLVHFWAPWCGPCKRLDRTVFTQPEVAKAITANYVPVKLNADQNAELAKRLGIKGVPNDVIFTPDGQVVGQFVSPATSEQYVSRMGQIAAAYGKASAARQLAATTTPLRGAVTSTDRRSPVNSAYANLAISTDSPSTPQRPAVAAVSMPNSASNPMVTPGSPTVPTTPSYTGAEPQLASRGAPPVAAAAAAYRSHEPTIQTTPPSAYAADRYAIPQQSPQAVVLEDSSASANMGRYAVVEQTSQPTPPPNVERRTAAVPSPPPTASKPPQKAIPSTARTANETATATSSRSPIPQTPTATPPREQVQVGQSLAAVPLGLDGYCPISLRNASLAPDDPNLWVRGDARWGLVHRGRTYLFAGQAERDQFYRSPDEYAPVLSGMDPVVAFSQGQMVPGQRELGVWYGGQIYLFSSEQSIKRFRQDPDLYAERIRQAMNVGKPTTLR